jgi:putative ABC transport system permease protein
MKNLLYGVAATDTLTVASVWTLLAVIALLARWLPARRASGVEPNHCLLREE